MWVAFLELEWLAREELNRSYANCGCNVLFTCSLETSVRVLLKELPIQIYLTLYFTFQSFMYEKDAIFSSFNAEDPDQLLRAAERDLSRWALLVLHN